MSGPIPAWICWVDEGFDETCKAVMGAMVHWRTHAIVAWLAYRKKKKLNAREVSIM